jgi:hypothetical protein
MRGESVHLFLHGELDAETLAMGFCPDEAGVDEADLFEPLQTAEADGEEFPTLELGGKPLLRGREVAHAVSAERDLRLLGNGLCDIDGIPEASDAETAAVWLDSRSCRSSSATMASRSGLSRTTICASGSGGVSLVVVHP